MSCWFDPLPFPIAPKSGPMRRMETLSQMNNALTTDLPFRQLCQPRWQHAARLVVLAAETGLAEDIQLACDAVVEALDQEGWMTADPVRLRLSPFSGRAAHLFSTLDSLAEVLPACTS